MMMDEVAVQASEHVFDSNVAGGDKQEINSGNDSHCFEIK